MLVYYGGEDTVTKLIAKRLIKYVAESDGRIELELEDANPRDHGTKALDNLNLMIRLSRTTPVICVFDSDGKCVVEILRKYAPDGWKNDKLAINIAVDEGETWLMADAKNFARYFGLKRASVPVKHVNSLELSESIPYKTSLYFLRELVPQSKKYRVIESLTCLRPGKKPPTYNNLWPDFIENHWDINEAIKNSNSLQRAVRRVQTALKMDTQQ